MVTRFSLFVGWHQIDELSLAYWLDKALLTGIVLSGGAVGTSLTNRLFLLVEGTSENKVAGIVRTFVAIGWWVVIAAAAAFVVGELTLTQALATSGVLVFTVGLALQPLILDAFSGLMLSIERSFSIGDWIEVQFPGLPEPVVGRVKDANWRSVLVMTRDGSEVTIPNHVITTKYLTNLSRPSPEVRIEILFLVENGYDLHEIIAIIAAKGKEYISGTSILAHPEPRIVVEGLKDRGVELKIQAWYRADLYSPDMPRTDLTLVLGRVMRECGWNFALPTLRYINVGDTPAREVIANRLPV
jgi:small-conductance mechanosensitive channel